MIISTTRQTAIWTVLIAVAAIVNQQAIGQTTVGIQPLGSYANGGIDQVNLAKPGIHVDIPLFQHKGRGSGMGINVHLVYDSGAGGGGTALGSGGASAQTDASFAVEAGTTVLGAILVNLVSKDFAPLPCQPGYYCNAGFYDQVYNFSFVDSTGYTHLFWNGQGATSVRCQGVSPDGCTNVNLIAGGSAADNSGYRFQVNPVTPSPEPNQVVVYAPSGEVYIWGINSITTMFDPNGNSGSTVTPGGGYWVNSSETLTDDSNVSATITGGAYNSSDCTQWTSRTPVQVQYLDTSGNTQTVTVNYTQPNGCTTALVSSVVYPDGSSYHFTYQSNGQLGSIQLPTGGTISYVTSFPIYSLQGTTVSRTTPDGTTTYSVTSYTHCGGCNTATSATSVSAPDGSTQSIAFFWAPDAAGQPNLTYETAHTWSSASGTLLKSTMRCYNGATGECTSTPFTLPITQIATTTTLDNGLSAQTVEYLNSNSLVTEVDEYDFGASSPSRKTVTSYAALGNNINNRPSSITGYDANGNIVKNTTYGYDEYSQYPLTPTTGLPYHNVVTGSRGNQTSQHAWLNTTNGTIDTHRKYDDAGQVRFAQDPRLNWTSYGYDPVTDICLTSTTPPTPSSGVSLATSATCDPFTGLLASTTDANGVTTTYLYDTTLRLLGSTTKTSTGTVAASKSITYSGSALPEIITTTVTATPSPNQVSTTILDGLGRTATQIAPNGATISTTYDSMGRVHSVSNPYITTNDPTYGLTSFSYDGLGRKTKETDSDGVNYQSWQYSGNQVTYTDEVHNQWRQASDAFGRLINVIEPGSLQTYYTYDVLGNLIKVNQVGNGTTDVPRVRTFTYDSLSRLLCAANPENSAAPCPLAAVTFDPYTYAYTRVYTPGTVEYSYDANSNVASKTDARGVTTNYSYDNVNRLLSKTYTNAPAGTLSSCYAYDTATVGAARMAAEWTLVGYNQGQTTSCSLTAPSSGYQTRRAFLVYDAMGRVKSEQQCIPSAPGSPGNCTTSSPTPFALSYNYDFAGNLNQYNNGLSGMFSPQIVFTPQYDGAGQLSTLTSTWDDYPTHPSTLFTADPTNGYSPAGGIQNVLLGNNIAVTKTYDNRLRTTGESATRH